MKKLSVSAFALLCAIFSLPASLQAGPPATVGQLDWMTGSWAGQLDPNQLEENWIATEGGSIAAIVRMTGSGATSMFEVIAIEEVDGSLMLNIQQWDPGFKSRTESPQTMELEEISTNSVKFRAVTEGGMSTLGYSHPDAETFIIHVGQPDSNVLDIPLKARSIW